MAKILNWTTLHKFVYTGRLIKGKSRMFIANCTWVNTWQRLKRKHIKEFYIPINSSPAHESYKQYLYAVIGMARVINLEDVADV